LQPDSWAEPLCPLVIRSVDIQNGSMPALQFRPIVVAVAVTVTVLLKTASAANPAVVSFDFSRHEVGLNVHVHGAPLYMFLDTGVSPSAIDTARARSLGLKIDFAGGGEASGAGTAQHVMVYPTSIDDLTIAGRRFDAIEALATDQKAISIAYGRRVDGTLGHSFLAGRVVLIDYQARTIAISDRKAHMASRVATCRSAWRIPLRSMKGDKIPIVDLEIGNVRLPFGLDTGSDGNVELFKNALGKPAVNSALVEAGMTKNTGTRGIYLSKIYRLNAPISLGQFVVPAGHSVTLSSDMGSPKSRFGNVGNRLLAGLNLKLLLDYRDNQIVFLGHCVKQTRRIR
jgi:hypothetical protein